MREALLRVADAVIGRGFDVDGRHRRRPLARDMLLARTTPRLAGLGVHRWSSRARPSLDPARSGSPSSSTRAPSDPGPPGSGKTYTGARMILDLVAAGKTVGRHVRSPTRRSATSSTDRRRARGGARASVAAIRMIPTVRRTVDAAASVWAGGQEVVAAAGSPPARRRSWRARSGCGPGPSSRARSTCCSSTRPASCRSPTWCDRRRDEALVLLGDPQQLPQVDPRHPPEGAGVSALEHLLGDAPRSRPERGLFLDDLRMHPDVNAFISELFYEGRLHPIRRARAAVADGRGCRHRVALGTGPPRGDASPVRRGGRRGRPRVERSSAAVTDRHGRRAARWPSTTSSSSPRTTPTSPGSSSSAPPGARRGSAPSTSSRARRRRS